MTHPARNAAVALCALLLAVALGALLPPPDTLAIPPERTVTGIRSFSPRTAEPIASAVRPDADSVTVDASPSAIATIATPSSPATVETPPPPIANAGSILVADTGAVATQATDPPESSVLSSVPRSITLLDGVPTLPSIAPFRDGESITLRATYKGMTAGNATMTVDTGGTYEGRPAIHLKAKAASGGMLSYVITIKDAGESWVDPSGLYSLGFVSDQEEGSIEDYQKWVMDNDDATATRHRVRRKDGGKDKSSTKEYLLTKTSLSSLLPTFSGNARR